MNPILYIVMRGDMASLNPGKAAAQACHAANKMTAFYQRQTMNQGIYANMLRDWEGDLGFGTTVVLQQPGFGPLELEDLVDKANRTDWVLSELIRDTSYPVKDGMFTHHLSIITCAYIFGMKDTVAPLVAHLPLMR